MEKQIKKLSAKKLDKITDRFGKAYKQIKKAKALMKSAGFPLKEISKIEEGLFDLDSKFNDVVEKRNKGL